MPRCASGLLDTAGLCVVPVCTFGVCCSLCVKTSMLRFDNQILHESHVRLAHEFILGKQISTRKQHYPPYYTAAYTADQHHDHGLVWPGAPRARDSTSTWLILITSTSYADLSHRRHLVGEGSTDIRDACFKLRLQPAATATECAVIAQCGVCYPYCLQELPCKMV